MGHAKTKVTVSCLFKSRLYQRTVSRNLCISLRRGHIKLSPCTISLRWSLSLSLSLSNKTRVYWNVVVFAFQTQYIRGLFVRNNIDTSLIICTLYSLFFTGILCLSSDFSTLSALISMNWIVHFRIKFAEKSFYSICHMRNWLRVTILWCNIICTIKWEIVLSGSACGHVCNWVTKYTRVFGFTIDLVLSVVDRACF